jgi:transcriptional regulator with XRE-family HTH domain
MAEDYKDTGFLRALGVIVKRQRQLIGASQEQLAESAGLHRTYVSDIERGIRNLTVSSAKRIANGLNVPISLLIVEAERYLSEGEVEKRPPINGFN